MSKNFATPPNLSEAAPRLGWRCFEGYETDTDVVWELSVLGCFCWQQNPESKGLPVATCSSNHFRFGHSFLIGPERIKLMRASFRGLKSKPYRANRPLRPPVWRNRQTVRKPRHTWVLAV